MPTFTYGIDDIVREYFAANGQDIPTFDDMIDSDYPAKEDIKGFTAIRDMLAKGLIPESAAYEFVKANWKGDMANPPSVATVKAWLSTANSWSAFPRETRRAFLGMAVCALRHLQDGKPNSTDISALFRTATLYSKDTQPGYVNGLTRADNPKGDSWLADMESHRASIR